MGKKILIKNNKLLKFGDNVLGMSNDYPSWQVNADTSEQFFDAFDDNRLAAPIDINSLTFTERLTINDGWYTNPVLAPDGIRVYYTPRSGSNILIFNSETFVPTYITIPFVSEQFSGGVLRGKYIYFIPRSGTYILKIDTENNVITNIGNYVGTNKWGKPILTSNGLIIAPGRNATTWLVIDKDDNVNLINMINTSVVYGCCEEGPGGFVYAFNITTNIPTIDRININTLVTSTVSANPLSTTHPFLASVRWRHLVFLMSGDSFPSSYTYNMLTNTWSAISSTASINRTDGCATLGPDGFIYFPPTAGGSFPFEVYNPVTLQRFLFKVNNNDNLTRVFLTCIINKNGRMILTRVGGRIWSVDLGIPLKENRYLSRIVNK